MCVGLGRRGVGIPPGSNSSLVLPRKQWSSNFSMLSNLLGGLLKTQIARPTPRVSDSGGLVRSWFENGKQRECTFPTSFPSEAEVAPPGTTWRTPVLKNSQKYRQWSYKKLRRAGVLRRRCKEKALAEEGWGRFTHR